MAKGHNVFVWFGTLLDAFKQIGYTCNTHYLLKLHNSTKLCVMQLPNSVCYEPLLSSVYILSRVYTLMCKVFWILSAKDSGFHVGFQKKNYFSSKSLQKIDNFSY